MTAHTSHGVQKTVVPPQGPKRQHTLLMFLVVRKSIQIVIKTNKKHLMLLWIIEYTPTLYAVMFYDVFIYICWDYRIYTNAKKSYGHGASKMQYYTCLLIGLLLKLRKMLVVMWKECACTKGERVTNNIFAMNMKDIK